MLPYAFDRLTTVSRCALNLRSERTRPADGIHHTVVVVRDLGLEPWAVALDQVGRVGGTKGGQEQRQRVDAVFVHIAGPRRSSGWSW